MPQILKTPSIPAPASALVSQITCPNSYYAPPNVIELERMTPPVAALMSSLWNKSVHPGQNIEIYIFKNVFVTQEGLVFDEQIQLIDCTRTLHSDQEIESSANAIRTIRKDGNIRLIPKAVLAKSRGAENYGHFIIEMLTRAWFARVYLKLTDWPALLHESSPDIQNVSIQALHQAGYDSAQILTCGREPVFLEELVFVHGLANHSKYMSPYVMQSLDAIADDIPPYDAPKIYVPRRPSPTRDFIRESKIATALAGMGFSEVVTTTLSFRDQIAAFKGASTVVGPMGAALTNLVFCRPGTDVFLFAPSSAAEVLFWMICQARRLNYCEIRVKESGPQTGNLPWDRALDVRPRHVTRIVSGKSLGFF